MKFLYLPPPLYPSLFTAIKAPDPSQKLKSKVFDPGHYTATEAPDPGHFTITMLTNIRAYMWYSVQGQVPQLQYNDQGQNIRIKFLTGVRSLIAVKRPR